MRRITITLAVALVAAILLFSTVQIMNIADVDAAKDSRQKACTNPRDPGEPVPKFCAQQTARVIVTKVVQGGINSPDDFTICVDTRDQSTGVITPATPHCAPGSGSGFSYTVKPGSILISEPQPLPPSYALTASSCGSVTAGQTATCTVTNTFIS